MVTSADDKANKGTKRSIYLFIFLYFKSALDYFHLDNLVYLQALHSQKFFVALNADWRVKEVTGFAFKRSSAVVMLNTKIRYIT